jgi:uncharacterized protein (TIGR00299 family) protein
MKTAHFDCFAGISGDMALGALIDAGADVEALRAGLATLPLPAWELRARKVTRHGFAATDVEVVVGGQPAGDAPAIAAADAPGGHHDHPHAHRHDEGHDHPHPHAAEGAHESLPRVPSRGLDEIRAIIRASGLPEVVRQRGDAVFLRLAEAEARVHNVSVETVHFHEVGAVDSIIDILGTVFALRLLGVEQVTASDLPTGRGFIQSAHGLLPVPAPATAELLKGIPVRSLDVEGELVTPTGAALMSCLARSFGPLPAMRPEATGYGAGKRTFPFPNLLRVFIGESVDGPAEAVEVAVLEANIDDMSPQLYEHVMELLADAGALDVYVQPVLMKKNRPAQVLSVLCEPAATTRLAGILLRETTTLGIRESRHARRCLQRELRVVDTPYGEVRVKVGWFGGQAVTLSPEYEDCRSIARKTGVPLKEVQAAALCAARAQGEELPPPTAG